MREGGREDEKGREEKGREEKDRTQTWMMHEC